MNKGTKIQKLERQRIIGHARVTWRSSTEKDIHSSIHRTFHVQNTQVHHCLSVPFAWVIGTWRGSTFPPSIVRVDVQQKAMSHFRESSRL